jgi:biopolymer transport protein ExbD
MKLAGAKQVHYESGPNMTPLVDVVMVILIFLMLAGSFGSTEHYMIGSAELHSAGVSKNKDPNYVPPIIMKMSVSENGDVMTEWGETFKAVSETDSRPLAQRLAESLEGKYKEVLKNPQIIERGGSPDDHVELIITANGKVKWELLAPVYDAALQAKVKKIGFM